MPLDMTQFHEGFFDEVGEHLERLEELIVAVEGADAKREDFDALFRAAHSIKGASGTFGFREMADLTHYLESVLDRAREGSLSVTRSFIDAVLETADVLKGQLADYRCGRVPAASNAYAAQAVLQALLDSNTVAAVRTAAAPAKLRRLHIEFATPRESVAAATTMTAMTSVLHDLGGFTIENANDHLLTCTLEGTHGPAEVADLFAFILLEGDILEIEELPASAPADDTFGFFEEEAAVPLLEPPTVSAAAKNGDCGTVRVKLEKIDTLINLVGELLIAQSSLEERAQKLDGVQFADLHASVSKLQRHTRDIRESVMAVRMLPIGSIFNRFPRMARDLAAQLGKEVALQTSGGETELDKGLIESVVDPLTHIIRNSIDHGIEDVQTRRACGKQPLGTVWLRSFQRGGNVVIEIGDDGAGMDRDRILAKAAALGIPIREKMSDREVWMLVCAPGFSTAQTVTEVSGRGVGMDVVKRNIAALGGKVEIASEKGLGTTISLVLPLTLAILDGLAVRTGSEVCIVPLSSISESIAISRKDVVQPPDRAPFILYRGEPLSLIGVPGAGATIEDGRERIAVVVEADGHKAGLLVDALESEHQVVIKSLETNFRRVPGFSGATVLGNGSVALILDIAELLSQ